jgi:hypothetical protein
MMHRYFPMWIDQQSAASLGIALCLLLASASACGRVDYDLIAVPIDAAREDATSSGDGVCSGGESCAEICPLGGCSLDCETGSMCNLVCERDEDSCVLRCAAGADCSLSCPDFPCVLLSSEECDGQECELQCGTIDGFVGCFVL